MSVAIENFVKAIYKHKHHEHRDTKPGTIAKELNISSAAATDMSKKLSEKGLLQYQKYQELQLTNAGTKMALSVIRKHRLWEAFLFKTFNMSLHDIHREAELLEHQTSNFLADTISEYLGNPKFDPHGDPIPSKNGEFKKTIKKLLNEVAIGTSGICVGVKDSSPPFLKFLDKNKIALGDTILVTDKEEFDESLYIQVRETNIHISNQIASNLYLKITA